MTPTINATVLIADDEPGNRKLLRALLEAAGYSVEEATCGVQALDAASQRPDLIILDLLMPGIDGIEVAARIKNTELTHDIPVVVITSMHDNSRRLAALQAGAEDFLTRPLNRHELLSRVRNLVRLKKLGDELRLHNERLEDTVRKRTKQLMDSEREYRTLVAASPAIVMRIDCEGHIRFINRVMKGQVPEDVIGTSIYDYLPKPQHDRIRVVMERVFSTGKRDRYQTRVYEPRERHYDTHIAPLLDGTRVIGAILEAYDVTREVNAKRVLSLTQLRFQQLADALKEALFFVDADGRIIDCNSLALRLTGLTTIHESTHLSDVICPKDRSRLQSLLQRGGGHLYEAQVISKGATSVPVEIDVSSMVSSTESNNSSKDPEFVVAIRDVSERRRHEKELREWSERLEAVFASLPAYVYTGYTSKRNDTASFLLTWVSDNVESITGLPATCHADSESWLHCMHQDDRGKFLRVLDDLAEEKVTEWNVTYRWLHPDRSVRWMLNTGRVVESDRKGRCVGVTMDITEQKNLEMQLQQSQKMEAIGKLAGGIAHDFNNLLTSIISFAGFVRDDLSPYDERRNDLREVLSAADKAAGLTRQLLLFSRQQPPDLKRVDVTTWLKGIERLLCRTIGEDVRLSIALPKEPLSVYADTIQLDQVVVNLAVNARDAMPGGGALGVAVYPARLGTADPSGCSAGNYVCIEVADTGTGMDEATQARIFEPFFTTKGPTKGTGLGLATCYGVVKQLGGDISVTSVLGTGTTMKILLPQFSGDEATECANSDVVADPRGTESVLIIEDEAAIRKIASRALREQGYNVLVAKDGLEGLKLFRDTESIDLVFSDIVLPRGNGFDVAETVRKERPNVAILLTSGYTDQRVERESAEFPILWKPYKPTDLVHRIRASLDEVKSSGNSLHPMMVESTTRSGPHRVLVVDDEEHVSRALCRILEDEGYAIESFAQIDAAQARLTRSQDFDAVVCDLNVEERSGLELLTWMEGTAPKLAQRFLLITGGGLAGDAASFADKYASRVVRKPFDVGRLLDQVASLVQEHSL